MATLFHLALKIKAVRKVPAGICKRCLGAGNGEEIADLGEALCHSSEFPMRKCTSCGGSGMAIAKTETTAVGLLLLFLIPAAIWVLPQSILFILTLSLVSIAAVEAMLWRYRESEEKTASLEAKQTPLEIFAGLDTPGPPTEGVLSLIDALESSRQTVVEPDMVHSIKPSHQDR
jgi:hypothetical protein